LIPVKAKHVANMPKSHIQTLLRICKVM